MVEFLSLSALGAVLAVVVCLFRAFTMLGRWRAAPARVWRSDYTDIQQRDDFWSMGFTLGTARGFDWRDGQNSRLIEDEIVYTRADGTDHRAVVRRRVRRGWRPDAAYVVWYDPANPAKVTVFGPFSWLGYAGLSALLVGLIVFTTIQSELPLPTLG